MAPAAVQTKQSVSAYSTSAPTLFTHASIAGALTPSRSPITSTRFPSSFMVALLIGMSDSRFQDERHAVRRVGHATEEQAALGHEQRPLHLARAHGPERVAEIAHGGGDVALGRSIARQAVVRDECRPAGPRDLAADAAPRG